MPGSKKMTIRVPKTKRTRKGSSKVSSGGLGPFPGRTLRTSQPIYTYDFHLQPQTLLMVQTPPQGSPSATLYGPGVPISQTTGVVVTVSQPANGISNSLDVGLACSHALSDVFSNPSFTAIYDQYRLDEISCKLTWMGGTRTGNGASLCPSFFFYNDLDDAVPPNALATILAKQGVMKWDPGSDGSRSVTYKFKPRLATMVSVPEQLSTAAGVAQPGQWLDCQFPTPQHYGSKIYLRDMSVPDNTVNPNLENAVRIEFSYRISFRNPLRCT